MNAESGREARRPNLFIVGAAKAGTTSLAAWLGEHPEVFMSPVKEPHWFLGEPPSFCESETEYLELFAGAGEEKILGEASTGYLLDPEVPRRIAKYSPDARIVICVREPVSRAHSAWRQARFKTGCETLDFQAALRAESGRAGSEEYAARVRQFWGVYPPQTLYLDASMYAERVARYREVFGAERVFVVVFEELVSDPSVTFRGLCRFLGIDEGFEPELGRTHNPASGSRFDALNRFLVKPPGWLKRTYDALPSWLRRFAYRVLTPVYWWNQKPLDRVAPPADVGDRYRAALEADRTRLEALLGRPMPWP